MIKRQDTDKVYIYKLTSVDSSDPVYIGQTKNISVRLWQHMAELNTVNKSNKALWIRKHNACFCLVVLEVTSGKLADYRESYWINFYLKQGYSFLNDYQFIELES